MAAAVLTGGHSRRMGRDKADIRIGGQTLLERAVDALAGVADPILIASGKQPHLQPGCITVADPVPGCGPLGGVVAALERCGMSHCAIVAVDMPGIDPRLLVRLRRLCDGADAAVPRTARGLEPLHAVYATSALAAAREQLAGDGDHSLQALLARLSVRCLDVDGADAARALVNLNLPAELRHWQRLQSEAG